MLSCPEDSTWELVAKKMHATISPNPSGHCLVSLKSYSPVELVIELHIMLRHLVVSVPRDTLLCWEGMPDGLEDLVANNLAESIS